MYLPVPVLAAIGIALLVLLLLALRRRGGERDLVAPPRFGAPAPPSPAPPSMQNAPRSWPAGAAPIGGVPPELEAELRALLAAGEKLEAIKQLRAATHMSLSDAKNAVERL